MGYNSGTLVKCAHTVLEIVVPIVIAGSEYGAGVSYVSDHGSSLSFDDVELALERYDELCGSTMVSGSTMMPHDGAWKGVSNEMALRCTLGSVLERMFRQVPGWYDAVRNPDSAGYRDAMSWLARELWRCAKADKTFLGAIRARKAAA